MIAIGLACNPKLLHRRRADHRARRDHPGADPGADEGPLAPARHRGRHHHAQPGHRRALCRPGERHVRRPPRRERNGGAGVRAAPAPLRARPAQRRAAPRPRAQRQARHHRGRAAQPAGAAARLPLPPALPLRHLHLPGGPAVRRRGAGPSGRLPPRARDRGARPPAALRPAEAAKASANGSAERHPGHQGHQQVLPHPRRPPAPPAADPCRQRRDARHQARRDPGPRRRVGLRQVDAGAAGAASRRSDGGRNPLRGRRPRPARGRRAVRHAQAHAGDLPGPLLLAQPAHDGGPDHRRAHVRARHPAAGEDPRAGRGAAAARRALPLHGRCATRTSCRAASASASASPGRSPSTRTSSSATRRSRRSTCRSRAR